MTTPQDQQPKPLNSSGTAALIAALQTDCDRQSRIVDIGGRKAAILKDGEEITSIKDELDLYLLKPERLQGTSTMNDLPSFMNECERFKSDALTVYVHAVDPSMAPEIAAVFNDSLPGAPDFGDHRAVYRPNASHEIRKWVSAGQKMMTQEEFAELIDDRLLDVKRPDPNDENFKPVLDAAAAFRLTVGTPAELLEVSHGLQVNMTANIGGKVNPQNGSVQVTYEDSNQPTVTVPGAVVLEIPFFEGATKVLILARIRYKVEDKKIKWRVLLQDLPRVYGEAVEDLCSEIREAKHRVVLGKPRS